MTLRKRSQRHLDEETTYWLSYSDMMAGLLLVFVLIISFTMLHAKVQYDEKQQQLVGKEEELMVRSAELEEERATVLTQQGLLDEQASRLDEQQKLLTDQEDAIALQSAQLAEQEEALRLQHELLDELEEIMAAQQTKLDNIIGVRSELIEALKEEFEDSDLHIAVDAQTGAITFDSSILFEYNEAELKDSGKEFLAKFLPRYVSILMSDEYRDYVSEIMIEGYTDTSGGYIFNLDLSQKRAYSVAEYCLSDDSGILGSSALQAFRSVASVNGRSYTNPVLKNDGSVDMEASRRVEFMFRLKDEEMIREMIEILNSEKNGNTSSAAAGPGTKQNEGQKNALNAERKPGDTDTSSGPGAGKASAQ